MPQMSPMSWMILFLMFTFLFLFFNILNYFNFIPTFKTPTSKNTPVASSFYNLSWKW